MTELSKNLKNKISMYRGKVEISIVLKSLLNDAIKLEEENFKLNQACLNHDKEIMVKDQANILEKIKIKDELKKAELDKLELLTVLKEEHDLFLNLVDNFSKSKKNSDLILMTSDKTEAAIKKYTKA